MKWLFLLTPLLYAESLAPNLHLFAIERSLNKNRVIYEVRQNENGFPANEPIQVYWEMLDQKGGGTEPLTSLEKNWAYGVDLLKVTPQEVTFAIKALPKRPVTVRRISQDAIFVATMIAERECELKGIYVQNTSKAKFAKVLYTEIKGICGRNEPASERIYAEKGISQN